MIDAYKTFIISENSEDWIATSIHIKQFAIMDIGEYYMEGSRWRVEKSLSNILENKTYNVSNIRSIIYNKTKDYTTIIFDKAEEFNHRQYIAIKFSITQGCITMDFYGSLNTVIMSFSSNYDMATSAKPLFKALCYLGKVETECAYISLDGKVYPSDTLYNYLNSKDIRSLPEIYPE